DEGPDLADVARRCGLSEREVIAAHTGREYTAFFVGFLPGFAYLGPVAPALELPRRAAPRPRVPPRSVGIPRRQPALHPAAAPARGAAPPRPPARPPVRPRRRPAHPHQCRGRRAVRRDGRAHLAGGRRARSRRALRAPDPRGAGARPPDHRPGRRPPRPASLG